MTTVLITDGNQRSALAITRSLGAAGFQMIVGDETVKNLSCASKYRRACFNYPSPYHNEADYVDALLNAVIKYRVDFIIPVTDISSVVISKHIGRLPPSVAVCMPSEDIYWAASDKAQLHRLAEKMGVPQPTRYYVQDMAQYKALRNEITFPCVLKPDRSIVKQGEGYAKTLVSRVDNIAQIDNLVQKNGVLTNSFMIQDVIQGEGVGVFVLCDHGEAQVTFCHKRIREKPPWGGVSVVRESIKVDPTIEALAKKLLREVCWHGVAMVEFKVCTKTGTPYLMEINGRFWGSLQLAIDAGIDFPRLLIDLYSGKEIFAQKSYRVGVKSRWFLGDVDHMLIRIKNRKRLDGELPGLGKTLLDFLVLWKTNMFYEVESFRDPGPSFYEVKSYFKSVISSGLKKMPIIKRN